MLQSSVRRGQMDRQGTFIAKDLEESESNEDKVAGWVEVETDPTVWLKKRELAGKTEMIAERPTLIQNVIFTADYRSDISTQNRLVVEGRVYEILAITDNGESRERYTDFLCNLLDTEVWT
jgi:SPP1 family predicted phage head-tail adaptor